jgi:PleD family two-component response regulator
MQLVVSFDDLVEGAATPPTLLIVDELDLNRRLLRGILKASEYRILEATRPSEALVLLETEKIDLIVVDLVMQGVSGPDFCRQVKSNRRTHLIPILMITSVQGVEP